MAGSMINPSILTNQNQYLQNTQNQLSMNPTALTSEDEKPSKPSSSSSDMVSLYIMQMIQQQQQQQQMMSQQLMSSASQSMQNIEMPAGIGNNNMYSPNRPYCSISYNGVKGPSKYV